MFKHQASEILNHQEGSSVKNKLQEDYREAQAEILELKEKIHELENNLPIPSPSKSIEMAEMTTESEPLLPTPKTNYVDAKKITISTRDWVALKNLGYGNTSLLRRLKSWDEEVQKLTTENNVLKQVIERGLASAG